MSGWVGGWVLTGCDAFFFQGGVGTVEFLAVVVEIDVELWVGWVGGWVGGWVDESSSNCVGGWVRRYVNGWVGGWIMMTE